MRRERGTGGTPRWRESERRWEVRVTGSDGKRRSIYCRTPGRAGERAVAKLRDQAIAASEAGMHPSSLPLASYAARWVARHPKLGAASRKRYADMVRLHLEGTAQGRIAVARVSPEDLEDLYADRLRAGMAPKSIELLHTIISGSLRQAAARGHAFRNVAALVSPPAIPRRKREVFSHDEVRAIVAVEDRLAALWTMAYQVPIREGELLSLTWADLDLERARLVLQMPEKDGVPRTLALPAQTVRALRAHRARQAAERLASGGAYEETDLVFATLTGDRIDPRRLREAFARVLTAAGARQMNFHSIRHTGATHMLEAGVPLKVVQEVLGHRSSRTTQDVYSHVTPGMQEHAVRVMEEALG